MFFKLDFLFRYMLTRWDSHRPAENIASSTDPRCLLFRSMSDDKSLILRNFHAEYPTAKFYYFPNLVVLRSPTCDLKQ